MIAKAVDDVAFGNDAGDTPILHDREGPDGEIFPAELVHRTALATVHGEFAPDPGHPVIHYTHHATGRHEGGWIVLNGTTYS